MAVPQTQREGGEIGCRKLDPSREVQRLLHLVALPGQ